MAMKSVSIRFEEEMLAKIGYVADYEGRSVNSQVLVLVRECIRQFEQDRCRTCCGGFLRLASEPAGMRQAGGARI